MTIYLVRHASAGSRGHGASDRERPLDEHGLLQAKEIATRLSGRRVDRILSSPAVRCAQTVEPLASALGLDVELDEALWEGRELEPMLELLFAAAERSGDSVLCSHGDMIPWTIGTLRSAGMPTEGRKQGCAKGHFWELHVSSRRIERATDHRVE